MKIIKMAEDFSIVPAGIHEKDGPYSGESFRKTILAPAIRENDAVEVNLDGILGVGVSFLKEAFGGLVREDKFSVDELKSKLTVTSYIKMYETYIWKCINNEN